MASVASTSCAMVQARSAIPSALAGVVRRASWTMKVAANRASRRPDWPRRLVCLGATALMRQLRRPYAGSETHFWLPHSHMNMRTVRPFLVSSILIAS
jgi:hypothetical protein